jgi:lysophospholipase L1-like esterase
MADVSRRALLQGALALPAALAANRATAECAPDDATARQLREDFPWLARYATDNAARIAAGTRVDVVFMGDSITEGWAKAHPAFFSARSGHVCRGISGQTTPQMVLRMMADVVALRPRAVHILGGTNDVAGNTGPMTATATRDNLRAMAILAQHAGIHVLVGSVPPAASFWWRPELQPRRAIQALNAAIAADVRALGATWVDYTPVLATDDGAMRGTCSDDGVHPNAAGYDAMETVLTPVLRQGPAPSRAGKRAAARA